MPLKLLITLHLGFKDSSRGTGLKRLRSSWENLISLELLVLAIVDTNTRTKMIDPLR